MMKMIRLGEFDINAGVDETANWSEFIPMTDEAIKAQNRHAKAVDDMWPEVKRLREEMHEAVSRLKAEMNRWRDEMVSAMPILKDHEFNIHDDQEHIRYVMDDKREPPAWVQDLLQKLGEAGGNSEDDSQTTH